MELSLPFNFYLIVFLIVCIILSILYIYYLKRGKTKDTGSYIHGLKHMAVGENRRAIEKFKESDLAGHITFKKGERSRIATEAAKIL